MSTYLQRAVEVAAERDKNRPSELEAQMRAKRAADEVAFNAQPWVIDAKQRMVDFAFDWSDDLELIITFFGEPRIWEIEGPIKGTVRCFELIIVAEADGFKEKFEIKSQNGGTSFFFTLSGDDTRIDEMADLPLALKNRETSTGPIMPSQLEDREKPPAPVARGRAGNPDRVFEIINQMIEENWMAKKSTSLPTR